MIRGETLTTGFYRFLFKPSEGSSSSDWKTRDVLVNKVCVGRYTSISEIEQQECNQIDGDVSIWANDDLRVVLGRIHEISGELKIVKRHRDGDYRVKFDMPHLVEVDDLSLRDVINGNSFSFPSLRKVSGDIDIHDTNLKKNGRLPAFPALKVIGELSLWFVSGYEDTFPALRSVGSLKIQKAAFNGFHGLEQVYGDLKIKGIDLRKKDIIGFSRIKEIAGDFTIEDNETLEIIKGFNQLEFIAGSLVFEDNEVLEKVEGLSALERIKKDFSFSRQQSNSEVCR